MPILPLVDIKNGILHPQTDLPPPQAGPEVLKQPRQLPILVRLSRVTARIMGEDLELLFPIGEILKLKASKMLGNVPVLYAPS